MKIQSPATNDTVSQSFTASGTYDPATNPTGVRGRLCQNGVCGAWVNGTFGPNGRPTWSVQFNNVPVGTYDVEVELTGVNPAKSDTTTNVTVEAAPKIILALPPHLDDPGSVDVDVQVTLAAGHPFVSIDLRLFNAAGNSESGFFLRVRNTTVGVGPHTLTGAAGEGHYVVATGTDAFGAATTTTAGAIKLT